MSEKIRVESDVYRNGKWVRDDVWLTKAQLQEYQNEIDTNEKVWARARR